MKSDLLKALKEVGVVQRRRVRLSHGGYSDFYIDIKKAYGYPYVLNLICDSLWEQMNTRTTCVAAMEYGGISPASILSTRYNLKLSLVRKKQKLHGLKKDIDGYVPNEEDWVTVIDDVFTTGKSLERIIKTVREYGANVLGCHVIVKRGVANLDVPVDYLFTEEDFL